MEYFDVDVDDEELEEMSTASTSSVVHDQLPTVEEIKAKVFLDDTTLAQRKQRNQQRFLVYLALSLLCAISLIGLIWIGSKRQRAHAGIVAVTETVRITSDKDVFRDKQSPQSRALHWMMYQDPLRLPLPTQHSDPFVQRYVVATFIFAVVPSQECHNGKGPAPALYSTRMFLECTCRIDSIFHHDHNGFQLREQ